jgi:hypothetical protein
VVGVFCEAHLSPPPKNKKFPLRGNKNKFSATRKNKKINFLVSGATPRDRGNKNKIKTIIYKNDAADPVCVSLRFVVRL